MGENCVTQRLTRGEAAGARCAFRYGFRSCIATCQTYIPSSATAPKDLALHFDANDGGRLDSRELMALHKAVAVEIGERESQAIGDRQANIIHRPADGRLFLILTIHPMDLAGHYYWWLAVGLVMSIECGVLAALMVIERVRL